MTTKRKRRHKPHNCLFIHSHTLHTVPNFTHRPKVPNHSPYLLHQNNRFFTTVQLRSPKKPSTSTPLLAFLSLKILRMPPRRRHQGSWHPRQRHRQLRADASRPRRSAKARDPGRRRYIVGILRAPTKGSAVVVAETGAAAHRLLRSPGP